MNYRDLIQLAPEQVEKLKKPLRPLSECDMERTFKKTNQTKDRLRTRATMGLAEMERCIGEIWKALLPRRHVRGTHKNEEKSWWRNIYIGHCMDLEIHWRKFFPEVWNIFLDKDYYRPFLRQSNDEVLHMKAFIFKKEWEKLVVCRYGNSFKIFFVLFLCFFFSQDADSVKHGLTGNLNSNKFKSPKKQTLKKTKISL